MVLMINISRWCHDTMRLNELNTKTKKQTFAVLFFIINQVLKDIIVNIKSYCMITVHIWTITDYNISCKSLVVYNHVASLLWTDGGNYYLYISSIFYFVLDIIRCIHCGFMCLFVAWFILLNCILISMKATGFITQTNVWRSHVSIFIISPWNYRFSIATF